MTIIIFIIVLGVLVFVHELGHFLVAKRAGVEVSEFGFGYPPRAMVLGKKWNTLFTLNWIPFGGFVKILGENYEEAEEDHSLLRQKAEKSFTQVSKKWQAAMLAAGVTFNILFAWLLFSLSFMAGLPASAENDYGAPVKNPELTVISVLPDSPAEKAGLKSGDRINQITLPGGKTESNLNAEEFSNLVNGADGQIKLEVNRGKEILNFDIVPQGGIVPDKKVIGVDMDMVGILRLPVHKAFYEAAKTTWQITSATVFGIAGLIKEAFLGKASLSSVTGPVGIVGLVGDASRLGFVYLVTFTALISINLAVINLVPLPALDGGRILFVAVEGIFKKSINPKFANVANTVGFALLIILMLAVTYRDILKLF